MIGWPGAFSSCLVRRGRPCGVANAPCSLVRSWRMGCTRMTFPSMESCTDPATIATSTLRPAQARPARYVAPAKETAPASTSRVTVSPVVASPGPPLRRHPSRPIRLVRAEPLRVGGDQHPGVEDLHQPVDGDHLDRLAGERRPDPIVEPGQRDPPVAVDPPRHPRRARRRPPASGVGTTATGSGDAAIDVRSASANRSTGGQPPTTGAAARCCTPPPRRPAPPAPRRSWRADGRGR